MDILCHQRLSLRSMIPLQPETTRIGLCSSYIILKCKTNRAENYYKNYVIVLCRHKPFIKSGTFSRDKCILTGISGFGISARLLFILSK